MKQALSVALFVLICALGAAAQNNGTNCTSEPPPCGWNAQCNDTDSGPVCSCEAGYQLDNVSACEMCPSGTWGVDCAYSCNCTGLDNSTTCNHVNGSCPDDGIINCYDDPCGEKAMCRNVNDSYECYCNTGYQLVNESSCEMCGWNMWGVNCSSNCSCMDNSTTCNHITGLCPEDEINCASSPCGANTDCVDISLGVYQCYCSNPGYVLMNDRECVECSGGMFGDNCTEVCSCGSGGNGCHHATGDCECNACYSGAMCGTSVGSDCVKDFLEIENKCSEDLKDIFGGDEYPEPPDNTLTALAVDLMDLDNAVVIQSEPDFMTVSRSDVNQGPLIKMTWVVDKNADRPNAEEGLDRLAEQVKLGNIRCTLIINSREDTTDVTINAGISICDNEDVV